MKLAVSLAFLATFAPWAAAQGTVTVEGVVVNKVTGAGIPDAVVWLWRPGTESSRAVSNEAGIFQFTGLEPGDYNSSVQKSGYSSPEPEELPPLEDRPKHHLSSGAEPVQLRFELNPPAVLRGRVIDADGNPVRVAVELGPGKPVNTDAEGAFAFENLWPGSYTLLARPIVMNPAKNAPGKDEIRTEPVPTYYPSVQDRSLTEPITVRAGADLNGYEIRLQSAEVHRVRGVVLNPDGKPAAKAKSSSMPRFPFIPASPLMGPPARGSPFPLGRVQVEGKLTSSPSQPRKMGCSSSLRSGWANGPFKSPRTGFATRSNSEIFSDSAAPRFEWSTRTWTT